MAIETIEITQNKNIIIIDDTGYYSAKEIAKCQENGINAVVAIPKLEKRQKDKGYYLHSDFIYEKESDSYICPNKQNLTKSTAIITKENGTKNYVYRAGSKTCNACSMRDKCIPKKTAYKRVSRSEYTDTVIKF